MSDEVKISADPKIMKFGHENPEGTIMNGNKNAEAARDFLMACGMSPLELTISQMVYCLLGLQSRNQISPMGNELLQTCVTQVGFAANISTERINQLLEWNDHAQQLALGEIKEN